MTTNTTIDMPEPNRSVVNRVCEDDALFFASTPGATYRERRYWPGELWPYDDKIVDPYSVRIVVYPIRPGVRIRTVIGAGAKAFAGIGCGDEDRRGQHD